MDHRRQQPQPFMETLPPTQQAKNSPKGKVWCQDSSRTLEACVYRAGRLDSRPVAQFMALFCSLTMITWISSRCGSAFQLVTTSCTWCSESSLRRLTLL